MSVKLEDPVGSIMTRGVIRVASHMNIDAAVRIMRQNQVSGVPVLEDGQLVGVLSNADLAKIVLHPDPDSLTTVAQVMTPMALALTQDVTVREASAAMVKHDVHRLLVVEPDGSLAGILSPLDILRHISK